MFGFFKSKDNSAVEDVTIGVATRNGNHPTYVNSAGHSYTLSSHTVPTATQALTTSEIIFTCVDFIASSVGQIKFTPVVKTNSKDMSSTKVPYNNKAVSRAFSVAPSPTTTWTELLEVATTQLLLAGETFITMELVGKQIEFTVIDSDTSVEILFDAEHPEIPTGYTIGATEYTLDEMIHIKRANIRGDLHGQSVLDALVDPLVVDGYASNDLISLYENGSVGDLYFSSEAPLAPSQVEQIEDKLRGKYTGSNRHTTFVLPNGLKPETLKINPKDSVVLDAMDISEDRILRAFKLHRVVLGGRVESYTTNIQDVTIMQFNNAVRPIINRIKDRFEVALRRRFKKDDIYLEVDLSNLPEITRSLTVHADTARSLYASGLASLNEARELVGLQALPDQLANEHFLPEFLHGSSLVSVEGLDEKQLEIIRDAKVAEAQSVIDTSKVPNGSDNPEGGTPNNDNPVAQK